ncbi:MAG: class I SAM-dependent methyltransferase [Enhydrobacter sp.]|nr:MAG: class I SAM-dependent methyltransferase [Enhydrobacter sp.]
MIAETFLWLVNRTPALRRAFWRGFFDLVAARTGDAHWWTLMNYGFADPAGDDAPFALQPRDEVERYPIALYRHVSGLAPIAGREVLEVGSGRGGGASYVARYARPRRMVGIDISGKAVAFCNRQHEVDNLHFRVGDAETLPFADASFDSVINVESSFCYPSLDRFLAEVKRVLRPGGHLHYADLRLIGEVDDWQATIERSGLERIVERDITANVVEALRRDSARRRLGGRRLLGSRLAPLADLFTGVDGTRIPALLANGGMVYRSFLLRKAAEPAAPAAYAAG